MSNGTQAYGLRGDDHGGMRTRRAGRIAQIRPYAVATLVAFAPAVMLWALGLVLPEHHRRCPGFAICPSGRDLARLAAEASLLVMVPV